MPGGIHPPLEVIATWPIPNYEDPQIQPRVVLILSCFLGPLSVALLLARLWVRVRMQHNAGWDDWLMLGAIVPIIAVTILCPMVISLYRFDRHIWDVPPVYFPIQRKYVMAIECLFCVASGLVKISILLFYRRISARIVSAGFRYVTWASIVFIAGYSTVFALIPFILCHPFSAFWEQVDIKKVGMNYKCLDEGADVFSAGVISAVQDLITAALPTFLYWNIAIPFRQKLALFGIFAIGYGVVVMAALRAYSSYYIFYRTYDVTWVITYNFTWTIIELHVGVMCANAPALKVFFAQMLHLERFSSHSRSRSNAASKKSAIALETWTTKNSQNRSGGSYAPRNGIWGYGTLETQTHISGEDDGEIQREPPQGIQKRSSVAIRSDSIENLMESPLRVSDIETENIRANSKEGSVGSRDDNIQALPSLGLPTTGHIRECDSRSRSPVPLLQAQAPQRYHWQSWS